MYFKCHSSLQWEDAGSRRLPGGGLCRHQPRPSKPQTQNIQNTFFFGLNTVADSPFSPHSIIVFEPMICIKSDLRGPGFHTVSNQLFPCWLPCKCICSCWVGRHGLWNYKVWDVFRQHLRKVSCINILPVSFSDIKLQQIQHKIHVVHSNIRELV